MAIYVEKEKDGRFSFNKQANVISYGANADAIMVTARYWTSQYEWFAHCKLALDAGLNPAIAKDVAENRRPANMDADEAMIYDFSRELHETKAVSDAKVALGLNENSGLEGALRNSV